MDDYKFTEDTPRELLEEAFRERAVELPEGYTYAAFLTDPRGYTYLAVTAPDLPAMVWVGDKSNKGAWERAFTPPGSLS